MTQEVNTTHLFVISQLFVEFLGRADMPFYMYKPDTYNIKLELFTININYGKY